jgi:cyclophilin family peptidyl-prolyl cis-trans isomerase
MQKITLIAIVMISLWACKKEDETTPTTTQPPTPTADVTPRFEIVEIATDWGNIHIWLHKNTPLHRANFIKLADSGFYNNTTFHRIIPGFMIQGGDPNSKDENPNNDGQGGPGYTIPAEILDTFRNDRGTIAAARLSNQANPLRASSGSQFYINVANNNSLNREYTVFGRVISGMNVADSIVIRPRGINDRPLADIKMQVKILRLTKVQIQDQFAFTVPE